MESRPIKDAAVGRGTRPPEFAPVPVAHDASLPTVSLPTPRRHPFVLTALALAYLTWLLVLAWIAFRATRGG